jgi:hypothetical protein
MNYFFKGFEKKAASLDWMIKKTIGGLKSRATPRGKKIADKVKRQYEELVESYPPQIKKTFQDQKATRRATQQNKEWQKEFRETYEPMKEHPKKADSFLKKLEEEYSG